MIYELLSLNAGGGVIPPHSKSKQYRGAASLAIGLGGTGLAALSRLKAKVYQQLLEDNPDEQSARKLYNHIQFLGIDADKLKTYAGEGALRDREDFFSIHEPDLGTLLTERKKLITDDHKFDWMDIEHIDRLLSPEGAGGIRQVGRYLLLKNVDSIMAEIRKKITTARADLNSPAIDIYIFAGISGGTGSGCFVDICYLVREVLRREGIHASSILGFFFLPDVVTSKPDLTDQMILDYNNSNGYAAMKELDYLMCLKDADDWFEQDYGSFQIRTQAKPVDMCHLISGKKADGSAFSNGFDYAVNVAADYALTYLSDVDLGNVQAGADNDTITIRGLVSNVTKSIGGLKPSYGANLNYEVIGAANFEIPLSQIASFLAADFYAKFDHDVGRGQVVLTQEDVRKFAVSTQIDIDSVYDKIVENSEMITLPDVDQMALAGCGVQNGNSLPGLWGIGRDEWITHMEAERAKKEKAITRDLSSYDITALNNVEGGNQSAAERVFRRLWDLSKDSAYGPYYAAQLLKNGAYDLDAFLTGEIGLAEGRAEDYRRDLINIRQTYVQASASFVARPKKKKLYQLYKAAAQSLCRQINAIQEMDELAATLRIIQDNLNKLYEQFFRPMTVMLNNLGETCRENMIFLNSEKATEHVEYTRRVLEFYQIKEHLQKLADAKSAREYVADFMDKVLKNYEVWKKGDELKICKFIGEYMTAQFEDEVNRSLDSFLGTKYELGVEELPDKIERELLPEIHKSAQPMFWRDAGFTIGQGSTVNYSTLSVPRTSTSICTAADSYVKNQERYTVRKTGLGDRIFAMRLICGVPLHGYHGVTLLKATYDASASVQAGVGSHLYSYTGRCNSAGVGGNVDWRSFLPAPIPYNLQKELVPEGKKREQVYLEGVRAGIIGIYDKAQAQQTVTAEKGAVVVDAGTQEEAAQKTAGAMYYDILKTPELADQDRKYLLANFLTEDGRLDEAALENERDRWQTLLDCLHKPAELAANIALWQQRNQLKRYFAREEGCAPEYRKLLNNGAEARKEECRIDYFVHYPKLCRLVEDELKKRELLQKRIDTLNEIAKEYKSYTDDIREFCDLLFFGKLECINGSGNLIAKKNDLIDRIRYRYEQDHESRVLELKVADESGDKDYALYNAFEDYRELRKAGKAPIPELRKWREQYLKNSRLQKDAVIPALLDEIWNSDGLAELRKNIRYRKESLQRDMLRFYSEMVGCIRELRRKIPDFWDQAKNELNGVKPINVPLQGTTPPPPPQQRVWTIYDNGQQLTMYEQYHRTDVAMTAAGEWVWLSPAAVVWDAANSRWQNLYENGKVNLP